MTAADAALCDSYASTIHVATGWGEGVCLRDGRLGRWRCHKCWKRAQQGEERQLRLL